jgi:NADH:ubiquinone oxidoreductase subunit 6 (subunit J)
LTNAPRPSRLTIFAAITAAVAGVVLFLRRRAAPEPPVIVPTIEEIELIAPAPVVPVAVPLPRASILTILLSGAGIICWIAAQSMMLTSRHPVAPLILFTLGFILIHPMLFYYERRWLDQPDDSPVLDEPLRLHWRVILRDYPREVTAVAVLTGLAAIFHMTLPHRSGVSAAIIWAILLVPAVFWMGYLYLGAQVGVIAAGFSAVNGWSLALSLADPAYSALALLFTLFLIALEYAWRKRDFIPLVLTSIVGVLVSPFFLIAAHLLLVRDIAVNLDERRRQRLLLDILITCLLIAVYLLLTREFSNQLNEISFSNPQYTLAEAFFNSLLMFNLTSDPNPLHGIINRPVFSPILASVFLIGLIGFAWRINARRRWLDTLLLLALAIGLLPSALLLTPPVRYPDLQRAAMALPVGLVIAACGMSLFVHLLTDRFGKTGVLIATALMIAALALIMTDARLHYTNTFIPILENLRTP